MYKCRICKKEVPEKELVKSKNPSGYLLLLCPCGGVVDLYVAQQGVQPTIYPQVHLPRLPRHKSESNLPAISG